jgi:hypothetical protein
MADKKKEKASASKPKLSLESKLFELITPSQLSSPDLILRNSPVQMVNQFTTLGSTISPRPTFQSTLVSHYDLFEDLEQPKPFKRFPKTSSHNLFIVEPDFSHLKSPKALLKPIIPRFGIFQLSTQKSLLSSTEMYFSKLSLYRSTRSNVSENRPKSYITLSL